MCLRFTCNSGTLHTYSKRSDCLLSAFNLTAVYCRLISNSVTVSPAECCGSASTRAPPPFIAHLLKLNANRKATITPSQYKVLPQFSRLTRIYGIDMSIVYRSKGFTIPPPLQKKTLNHSYHSMVPKMSFHHIPYIHHCFWGGTVFKY